MSVALRADQGTREVEREGLLPWQDALEIEVERGRERALAEPGLRIELLVDHAFAALVRCALVIVAQHGIEGIALGQHIVEGEVYGMVVPRQPVVDARLRAVDVGRGEMEVLGPVGMCVADVAVVHGVAHTPLCVSPVVFGGERVLAEGHDGRVGGLRVHQSSGLPVAHDDVDHSAEALIAIPLLLVIFYMLGGFPR